MLPSIKEKVRTATQEAIWGVLEGAKDVLLELSYAVALVGGGVLILMHVAGWEKAKQYTGMVLVAHVMIKFVLG